MTDADVCEACGKTPEPPLRCGHVFPGDATKHFRVLCHACTKVYSMGFFDARTTERAAPCARQSTRSKTM
jgi:hypothetical protein